MKKKFNHKKVETGKNQKWIDKEFFSKNDNKKDPFSIILPPPNVTGKLHLGHAWDGFIQDTLIRFYKLKGKDVLWIPGMDHAGIATQAKVEERLRKIGVSRYDLGREKFLEKVWEWKEDYASLIRKQWGKLGLALNYKMERFTMDSGLSSAVQKVFVKMHQDKLIYRGEKAINWDTQLQTVLSNIEVINKETEQKMYYIKYDVKNGDNILIATVRTETLYSDVAIGINPNDEKMSSYIGKIAIHPLTNKEIPIIADEHIEINKGTGAMKISAHAETDYEILIKNNLPLIESIDLNGKMNKNAYEYEGIDRFKARELIAKKLDEMGRIVKIEKTISAVGYSERSNTPVEILVQPQWFVNMEPLSKKILKDLKLDSGVKFYPKRFEDVLKKWMNEIRDWCISRQLWWGHRIPAWYKGKDVKVQIESPGSDWKQDEDVLDTWFSSALAPFSFLGWPNSKSYLSRYYPTSVLVTGYDIIFFWVARMYFQSLEFMGEKPFKHALIHGLIRAEDGRKMSKSLGNGIDPMDVIEEHGSDSLRWFLLTNSTPGQDIRYSTQKINAAWNLNNKLWNISRYIIDIMEGGNVTTDADNWIINKLSNLEKNVSNKMKTYEFTIIGKEIAKFIQDDFSSWYIEFTKSSPNKKVATWVLKKLLIIMHPFMPFITDHIYNLIDGKELLDDEWKEIKSENNTKYIDEVIEITKALREFRVTQNLSNSTELKYFSKNELSKEAINMIKTLANSSIEKNNDAKIPLSKNVMYVKLSDQMKMEEKKRINKKIKFLEFEISRAEGMLANSKFVLKAPKAKVLEEKQKLKKLKLQLKEIKETE
ncbi:MAG: valine--tRNA ligase [Mycoplasmatales bacterium]|nr:valine--tRNA ligase [Mycoplasmatales bacterium]